ncbi:diguanylate cyclase [Glaciecola siphonariae]|uniref:diguanylate cyclase n=1 Tax=Glaciecola siphonariae TaxID=521012 RepID=A0ABV9LZV6_9ALTE
MIVGTRSTQKLAQQSEHGSTQDNAHLQSEAPYSILASVRQQPLITAFLALSLTLLIYVCVQLGIAQTATRDIGARSFLVESNVASSGGKMTIEQVLALSPSAWRSADKLNFGNTTDAHWIKARLKNNDGVNRRLLLMDDILLDEVELWIVDEQQNILEYAQFGDTQPFYYRPIASASFLLEIPSADGELTVIARAQTSIALNLNFDIWDSALYLEHMSNLTLFHGLIFGYIFALICYSLLMFATSNNTEYVYYAGYLLAFGLHLAAVTGHGFHYLWPSSVYLQQTISTLSINVVTLCLFLFTQKVLHLKHSNILAARLLKWQIWLYAVFVGLGIFFPSAALVKVSVLSLALFSSTSIVICLMSRSHGKARANFFALVWGVLSMSVFLSALARFGLLPVRVEPIFILIIAFALETLLIGTALINMYRRNKYHARKDKELALAKERDMLMAKDELIQTQRDAQARLEKQVQAQTAQLESALGELSKTSAELKQMRNVDGLTGLPNRYLFDEHLSEVTAQCIQSQSVLGIAALDLDHFKHINDAYGHLGGDHVLKAFAQMLGSLAQQHDLFVCRFGGEEFIAVGNNKSLDDMTAIMEGVRLALEQNIIEFQGQQIACTVSIGLVAKVPEQLDDHKTMLAHADNLLYRAKQQGRNLVVGEGEA